MHLFLNVDLLLRLIGSTKIQRGNEKKTNKQISFIDLHDFSVVDKQLRIYLIAISIISVFSIRL